jgi:hypothetical protein
MTESTESKVKIEGKFYPLQHQEWVKACRELTSGARDTLYYIRTTDPYSNGIELTAAAIAKELGVNRSTISRAMKELDSKGFIEMEIISAKVAVTGKGLLDVYQMQQCCTSATASAEMQQPVQKCNNRPLKPLHREGRILLRLLRLIKNFLILSQNRSERDF